MSSLYYLTFILLMITNWFLWKYTTKYNLSGASSSKYMTISLVFAVSYMYRAVYDTILAYTNKIGEMAE